MSTSNRRAAFAQPQSNPATKFIEWKSNDKCFSYYDKEIAESLKGSDAEVIKEKANVQIALPFKFLVLDELHKVEGWNDSLKGKIVSNEVKFISKEIMKVKTYHKDFGGKNTTTHLVDGLYAEIKEKVKSSNAHYAKSIYVMLEDGSLANLQLKGSGVQKWGDFTQKTRNRLADEWVIVAKAEDGKKGAVKFSTPSFSFANSISEEEANMADEAFNILESYLKTYLAKADIDVVLNGDIANDFNDMQDADDDGLDF
jgi:hypothetical protein